MKKITASITCLLFISFAWSQVKLPKLISDGMVLQSDVQLNIWGWASENENVTLSFEGRQFHAKADASGKWNIELPAQKPGGPVTMRIEGSNIITINNVLFGDVWLCSGQSNMELAMNRLKDAYPEIVSGYENNQIRQFVVPDTYDFKSSHEDLSGGSWKILSKNNIQEFSGIALFFAKYLNEHYDTPIGLINSALGGSPVEAWMSERTLKKFPSSYNEYLQYKNVQFVDSIKKSDKNRKDKWFETVEKSDHGLVKNSEWYLDKTNTDNWGNFNLPGYWSDQGLENTNGVVWFKKKIFVPKSMAGKKAKLWFGRVVDQDYIYVNSTFIGYTSYQYPPRKYEVPEGILKEGENIITVRVINESGKGGFLSDKPYFLTSGKDTINLSGEWKYNLGVKMSGLRGPTFIRWKPGGLYNAMIAPLLDYKIKGVIWSQGESNTKAPKSYFETFPALIENWREDWSCGEFPFLFVQLANYMKPYERPSDSNWAMLRQAQLETLKLPNTGMAVAIDLGEWNDIHPLNKEDVGNRLAYLAQRLVYKENIDLTSPIPGAYKFTQTSVEISFEHASEGLMSKDGKNLRYFEISNDGVHFEIAKAQISGAIVKVWNDTIKNPKAVRYAWANNPSQVNFYGNNGLPVSPFEIKNSTNNNMQIKNEDSNDK